MAVNVRINIKAWECELETERYTGTDRKATLHRNVIEHLCVCKRDGFEERERNCSNSAMLSTFERFVTGERIMKAVKWGYINMPAAEEHNVG